MFFSLRAEAQLIDMLDDLAEVVAAGDFVLDLAEDFTDFVFDGVRSRGPLPEAVEVGEQLSTDEVTEIVAGRGFIQVDLAVFALRRGPFFPAVGLVKNEGVLLPLQGSLVGSVLLQSVQVFQEKEPGRT